MLCLKVFGGLGRLTVALHNKVLLYILFTFCLNVFYISFVAMLLSCFVMFCYVFDIKVVMCYFVLLFVLLCFAMCLLCFACFAMFLSCFCYDLLCVCYILLCFCYVLLWFRMFCYVFAMVLHCLPMFCCQRAQCATRGVPQVSRDALASNAIHNHLVCAAVTGSPG